MVEDAKSNTSNSISSKLKSKFIKKNRDARQEEEKKDFGEVRVKFTDSAKPLELHEYIKFFREPAGKGKKNEETIEIKILFAVTRDI